jgi:WD40 repeat protein
MVRSNEKVVARSPDLKRARLAALSNLVKSKKSGHLEKYHQLLTDFNFLAEKINHPEFGVQALMDDYDLIEELPLEREEPPQPSSLKLRLVRGENISLHPEQVKTLKLIQGALRLSAHVLAKDKTQLAGQLLGRLQCFEVPEIQEMLAVAKQWKDKPWLCPLTPSITPPGGRLLRIFTGHRDSVNAVAVTSDGKRVISGSSDTTVKVWNLDTGEEVFNLTGHRDSVNAVAITSDGKRVISGSSDTTVKAWNLDTGEEVFNLTGHTGSVNAVAVTSDGKRVVSGSSDITVKVWNLDTGEETLTFTGHCDSVNRADVTPDSVTAVTITPDDKWVISGAAASQLRKTGSSRTSSSFDSSFDQYSWLPRGRCKVWDLNTGKEILDLEPSLRIMGEVHAIVVTPNGELMISGTSLGLLRGWNLKIGKKNKPREVEKLPTPIKFLRRVVRTRNKNFGVFGHSDKVKALTLTSDGNQLISGSFDTTVKVWNLDTGEKILSLTGHTGSVNAVAVTPNGKWVISGSSDKTLKLWNLESEDNNFTITNDNILLEPPLITDNKKYWIFGLRDDTIKIFFSGISDKQQLPDDGESSSVYVFADIGNSKHLIYATYDNILKDLNLETGELLFLGSQGSELSRFLRYIKGDSYVRLVYIATIYSIIALFLIVAFYSIPGFNLIRYLMGFILIISIEFPLQVLSEIDETNRKFYRTTIAVTPDGEQVISGSSLGTVKVWDLKSRKEQFILIGHTDSVNAIAATPNGKRLISGSSDTTIKVWNLKTGKEILTLNGHSAPVNTVAITLDSQWLISGSSDTTVKVWKLETGEEILTLTGHSGSVKAVAVTPDSKRVISSSDDNTLKIWNLSSGKVIASFTGESELTCCAVAPDGVTIVAREKSGRMHFLRLEGMEASP